STSSRAATAAGASRYQWLPTRGAWNEERLWHPFHAGQPAWIVPPVCNVAHGPSGLAYDPGTGLPERFRHCFLLCDFRGNAAYSGILALRFRPHGAGFEPVSRDELVWNVLATDVEFGPDGAVYATDWVHGWSKTGRGRLWRLYAPEALDDALVRE